MAFLSPLKLVCALGEETYFVDAPFVYQQKIVPLSEYYLVHSMDIITVPKGFSTDFASIPKLFWNILSPESPHIREASVIHDWLYTQKVIYTRKQADEILRGAMIELGASKLLANIVYWSVRICGGSHWKD